MKSNNWRWSNDWIGIRIKRVYVDEYSKEGDFELPELVSPQQISKINKLGPGLKSWIYIQWLKFKMKSIR